ncbi:unnamed protein product [Adineta ricciae]|uniref:Uncharacterized protein n=1 Tax=Adineta ricciae TaxID=249248 RepID=A0A813VMS2_ADIRI|nr:unnamed protein product [Adineta ricciae]CAF1024922.1 unnamed protein product [Adineta ricciae]
MTTTAAARTKENGCDFSLFKTPLRNPLRTPIRNGMLSSATLNDLASYSNNNPNKHLKFVNATSMNDLQMCSESTTTPIRFNKSKFDTPVSTQRRRALGLVNHNSNHISRVVSSDDFTRMNALKNVNTKQEEPISKTAPSHPEDDLPHVNHSNQDTFDDLIPMDERIEHMIMKQTNGVNMFSYYGGLENTIRCQSPVCTLVDVPTLLDMIDILN